MERRGMEEEGFVRIAGRRYVSTVLRLRRKMVRAKGHAYPHHTITVPKEIAEWMLSHPQARDPETGKPLDTTPVVVLLAPADWYHLLLWKPDDWLWKRIPRNARQELEALALDPSGEETILIPAKKSELEALGLDPSKPITLEDLKKALEKKAKPAVAPA